MFDLPIGRRTLLRRLGLALGGVATAPLASALLSGCRTPSDLDAYEYAALDADQQRTLSALVDHILPATDTPGASDVGVPQFIDQMLAEWYAPDERAAFLADLGAIDRRASGAFLSLDAEAQARLVATLDAEAYADQPGAVGSEARPDEDAIDANTAEAAREGTFNQQQEQDLAVAGTQGDLGQAQSDTTAAADAPAEAPPFFRQLKELTLAGYYTSEPGATQELQWLAAPGKWDADAPLAEIGRAWA